ncbi:MAG: putative metal-binding motif-containing protein [Candidatus Aenigmatarchaeota archaeon]
MESKKISVFCFLLFIFTISSCQASSVSRTFSKTTLSPGENLIVNLTVSITLPQDTYYAIDEVYPSGWTVVSTDGDRNQSGHIKWVVIENGVNTTYTYIIKAPTTTGTYTFSGIYMFNSTYPNEIQISGQNEVQVATCINMTFYRDYDNDGYGNSSWTIQSCTQPSGYVNNSLDCNDSNYNIRPNATEMCNGIDDNCNGYIDENLSGCTTSIKVTTNYYDGSTTNFSNLNLSQSIQQMVLEKLGAGKIVFRENITFTQSVNLDFFTNISFNRAYINSSALPILNKPATIYLYNLNFINPLILRDGSSCPSSICTFVSYSGGTLVFNVTQFTTYSATEGCGNNICDPAETCSSCPQDCGQCPCPQGQTRCSDGVCRTNCGGGGGGGGTPTCTNGQTRNCSVAHKGKCALGTETCVNGNWMGCPAPSTEICNKEDDDCNGQVDESLTCLCYVGESRACGPKFGECKEGKSYCSASGAWGECIGYIGPSEEVCNGKDDDCDNEIDENCVPEENIKICENGLIPEEGCMCGDKFYTIGYCFDGVYSKTGPPEFPWIVVSIFGVIIVLVLTIVIIYKEFHKKGKKEVTWDDLLRKYRTGFSA